MTYHLDDAFAAIRDDREHGAAELAETGLRALGRGCHQLAGANCSNLLESVAAWACQLEGLRPSMAPIGNWAAAFYAALRVRLNADAAASAGPEEVCEAVLADLLAQKAAMRDAQVAAARPILAPAGCILTLSYSSTVEAMLASAAASDCRVVVAESRPLFEGRVLCRRLESAGRRVRSITDAQIGLAARDADLALIGADAVLSDLSVVNKVGSLLAGLAVRDRRKPLYVAADTFKIDARRSSGDVTLEAKDGAEVWRERPEICDNVYFETVPVELVSLYLTEKGPLTPERMRSEVAAWRACWHSRGLETDR